MDHKLDRQKPLPTTLISHTLFALLNYANRGTYNNPVKGGIHTPLSGDREGR